MFLVVLVKCSCTGKYPFVHLKAAVLRLMQLSPPPPGDIWQSLKTFPVVTTWARGMLLASSKEIPEIPLSTY